MYKKKLGTRNYRNYSDDKLKCRFWLRAKYHVRYQYSCGTGNRTGITIFFLHIILSQTHPLVRLALPQTVPVIEKHMFKILSQSHPNPGVTLAQILIFKKNIKYLTYIKTIV